MHFYYLDEAGCTGGNLNDDKQPVFVLGGVSVRDKSWNKTQEKFSEIISQYFDGNVPKNFELHAAELLSPNGKNSFECHERSKRSELALAILSLLNALRHDVHLFAIDKQKLADGELSLELPYDHKIPYLVAYDYLLTKINSFIKNNLGRSARGMIILDKKDYFHSSIEEITRHRRFDGVASSRIKRIVEFSYPVDSAKNPMIQFSDLVVFCAKKFFEIDAGYRDNYPDDAKQFFAKCYQIIDCRIRSKNVIPRGGRNSEHIDSFLGNIRCKPTQGWKQKYGIE